MITLPKDTKLPDHVAMILDGNRRWAKNRGLPKLQGHRVGLLETLRNTVRFVRDSRDFAPVYSWLL